MNPAHPSCAACPAACCRGWPVPLQPMDVVPDKLRDGSKMRMREDGYCAANDPKTRLCTIYDTRPAVCRDFKIDGRLCVQAKEKI